MGIGKMVNLRMHLDLLICQYLTMGHQQAAQGSSHSGQRRTNEVAIPDQVHKQTQHTKSGSASIASLPEKIQRNHLHPSDEG